MSAASPSAARASPPLRPAASRSTTTTCAAACSSPAVQDVTMVSATANAIGAAPATVPLRWSAHVGTRNQLAYYSNSGLRVDLAAPGGARAYEIPAWDGGANATCWPAAGARSAPSPARPGAHRPARGVGLQLRLLQVAGRRVWLAREPRCRPRTRPALPPSCSRRTRSSSDDPRRWCAAHRLRKPLACELRGPEQTPQSTAPALNGTPFATGFCHVDQSHPIAFADAYGAGLVDAGAAVQP